MQFAGTDVALLEVTYYKCAHCDLSWTGDGPPAEAELTVWYGADKHIKATEYESFRALIGDIRRTSEPIDCIELGDGRWFCSEASRIIAEAEWAMPLFYQVRKNARKRKIPFTLSRWDFLEIVARSAGKCELTAIPFDAAAGDWNRRPWMASVDRVDSSKPYQRDNVRLVCYAVNCAMNEWGSGVLDEIVRARAPFLEE